jgi:hypothetical protein
VGIGQTFENEAAVQIVYKYCKGEITYGGPAHGRDDNDNDYKNNNLSETISRHTEKNFN